MKRCLSLLLTVIVLIITLYPITAQGISSAPSGYTAITTAQEFSNIRNNMSGKYILMNDIDLTSLAWSAIGYSSDGSVAFTGILDGNGHSVTGLDTTSHDPKTALFWTNSGTIQNLTVTGSYTTYALYAGVFCHYNTGTILNCHNKATVTHTKGSSSGDRFVGGITGSNTGTIQYCSNQADITATSSNYGSSDMNNNVGGIAGINGGTIRECWNTGAISGYGNSADPNVGGIAGTCGSNAKFTNCYNSGKIYGSSGTSSEAWNLLLGGIVANGGNSVTVTTCYNRGTISAGSARYKYYGSLVGMPGNLTFKDCYYMESGTLNATYSKGTVSGTTKLTVSQMTVQSNYTGFDFSSVWNMGTYPVLKIRCTHPVEYVAAKEPTCTTDGNIAYYYCNICVRYFSNSSKATEITRASTILPGGHSYGEWVVTLEATCTEDGMQRQDCENCDYYVEEAITAKGHNYEDAVTDPTCTEQGFTTHTCGACGDCYVDSYTDPLWHTFTDGTCKACGTSEPFLGDVNMDGEINIFDANMIVAYYNETIELTDAQLKLADVNGDGAINIFDANLIVAYYNEAIDAFPAEKD